MPLVASANHCSMREKRAPKNASAMEGVDVACFERDAHGIVERPGLLADAGHGRRRYAVAYGYGASFKIHLRRNAARERDGPLPRRARVSQDLPGIRRDDTRERRTLACRRELHTHWHARIHRDDVSGGDAGVGDREHFRVVVARGVRR